MPDSPLRETPSGPAYLGGCGAAREAVRAGRSTPRGTSGSRRREVPASSWSDAADEAWPAARHCCAAPSPADRAVPARWRAPRPGRPSTTSRSDRQALAGRGQGLDSPLVAEIVRESPCRRVPSTASTGSAGSGRSRDVRRPERGARGSCERRRRGERAARLGRVVEAGTDRLDHSAAPAGGRDRDGEMQPPSRAARSPVRAGR